MKFTEEETFLAAIIAGVAWMPMVLFAMLFQEQIKAIASTPEFTISFIIITLFWSLRRVYYRFIKK